MRDRWDVRRLALLLLFAIGLSACSPPEPGRVVRDLALGPEGQLIEIDANDRLESPRPPAELSEMGMSTEVCLDDGTCVRLVDERQILESTDRWDTSTVVWSVSPSDTFWRHEYDDGHNPVVVGLFDIVVLPDQSIAVASGQLPLIERSVDGEWTPTVAPLQTLPSSSLFFALGAAAVVAVAGLAFGTPHGGAGAARLALLIAAPLFGLGALLTLAAAKDLGFFVVGALLLPLCLTSAGLVVGSVLRARAGDDLTSSHVVRLLGTSGGAFVSWMVVYLLWSQAMVAWDRSLAFWVVSFVVAVIVACRRPKVERQTHRTRVPEQPVSLGGTVVSSVFVAYVGVIGAMALVAGVQGAGDSEQPELLGLFLSAFVTAAGLALVAGVVWFTAWRTLSANKTRPPIR